MGNDSNRWRSSAIGTPLRTLPRTAVDFVKQAVDASSQRCELAVDGQMVAVVVYLVCFSRSAITIGNPIRNP